MTPKQTKIVAVGSVIAVVLTGLAWFFGVSPQLSKANESKTASDQAVTATDALRATQASLMQKEAEIETAAREYQDLARQFPASFQPSEWVTMVMGAAQQSGVKLTTLAPSVPALGAGTAAAPGAVPGAPAAPAAPAPPPPPADPAAPAGDPAAAGGETLAVSTVSLTAEGSPAALRDFLRRLGQMARPILIENAAISTAEGQSTLTVSGRTFLMRALADPAAGVLPGEDPESSEAPEVADPPVDPNASPGQPEGEE